MQISFNKTLRICAVFLTLSIIGILFIDKPITIFMHDHYFDTYTQLRILTEFTPPAALFIAFVGVVIHYFKDKIKLVIYFMYIYVGLEITLMLKTGLKIVAGRYWPKTWINHNLSLIDNNVYGFNWLHGYGNQGSFPSGHSTYTVYCMTWFILLMPKYRYLGIMVCVIGIAPQIILDYHFFGDCMVGISFGVITATSFAILWQKHIEQRIPIKLT